MPSLAERIQSPRRTFQRAIHAVGGIVRIETVVEDTRDLRKYTDTVVSAQKIGDALNAPEGTSKLKDFEREELSGELLRLRRDVHIGISASTGFVFLDVPIGPAWDHQVHPKPKHPHDSRPVIIWDESHDNEGNPKS
ncbi:MAG: hypothetical protein ACD_37C00069G0007, partial [uncultured bacterium]